MNIRSINIFLLICLAILVVFVLIDNIYGGKADKGPVVVIDGEKINIFSGSQTGPEVKNRELFGGAVCAVLDTKNYQLIVYLPGVNPTPHYDLLRIKNLVIFTKTPRGEPTKITTWTRENKDYRGDFYETIEIRLHSSREIRVI